MSEPQPVEPAPAETASQSQNLNDDINALSVDELDRLTQNVLDETASTRPLLSESAPLSALREEYERGSATFLKQIDYLSGKAYTHFRRARGDGDCFYRSLGFAWVESLMTSQEPDMEASMALSLLESSLDILAAAGFQKLVYEDFYDTLANLIKHIFTPGAGGQTLTMSSLLGAFQNAEISNSIVVYLRLLTSATIRTDEDNYAPFLFHPEIGDQLEPREFCENFVEACGREADHVQITALTKALNFSIQVAYLDGHGTDGTVNFVEFQIAPPQEGSLPPPVLLYRWCEIMAVSRVYADVNASLGAGWYDYERLHIDWNVPDRYEIVRRVGGGKYSEVFEGVDMSNEDRCIIKVLKPVMKKKIKREVKILRNLTGGPNIISLLDVVQDGPSRSNSLIMEYVDNTEWKELFPVWTETEMKHYLFQLLKGLDFVHSRGIMHRDLKPANIMYDRARGKLRLIDWGLAEFYHPDTKYHVRVGSRYWKAPELLVGYEKYDYSLDLWSVGCMLASMVFRKEAFFRGRDNEDQLLRILKVLGTDTFERYLEKYGLYIQTDNRALLQSYARVPFNAFGPPTVSREALDLLDKLLRYDHLERLTAAEALAHPYFTIIVIATSHEDILP
ncbi:hypothetical protein EUX98_g3677 [Antrodiella citrinella]|uniref:Casein kinase II subunit alpha n=1 Tax=Antrodiella citrinella TaxID=2447956 RepID=A0A4S4MVW4_9APHY|nr:hypothetical protein EUX98_g3677 [Antrodiella citrinella]